MELLLSRAELTIKVWVRLWRFQAPTLRLSVLLSIVAGFVPSELCSMYDWNLARMHENLQISSSADFLHTLTLWHDANGGFLGINDTCDRLAQFFIEKKYKNEYNSS